MKIFLDDERMPKNGGWLSYERVIELKNQQDWLVVRNYGEFVNVVVAYFHDIETMSLDHDLGDSLNGYECAKWLVDYIMDNGQPNNLKTVSVHSQNPVGKKNIINYFQTAFYAKVVNFTVIE